MLLEKEYSFGKCLSLEQRTHSVDDGRSCNPWKLSAQMEQLRASNCAWKVCIFARTACCSNSECCDWRSLPSLTLRNRASLSRLVSDASLSSLHAVDWSLLPLLTRCWLELIRYSLVSLASADSDASLSCWLELIRCSLVSLASDDAAARRSPAPVSCSLASLSSAVSAAETQAIHHHGIYTRTTVDLRPSTSIPLLTFDLNHAALLTFDLHSLLTFDLNHTHSDLWYMVLSSRCHNYIGAASEENM